MKKIIAIFFTLAVVTGLLAGCGAKKKEPLHLYVFGTERASYEEAFSAYFDVTTYDAESCMKDGGFFVFFGDVHNVFVANSSETFDAFKNLVNEQGVREKLYDIALRVDGSTVKAAHLSHSSAIISGAILAEREITTNKTGADAAVIAVQEIIK